MNTTLKILAAITMISIIIAAGVFTVKTLTEEPIIKKEPVKPLEPTTTGPKPTKPEVFVRVPDERSVPKYSEPITVTKEDPLQPQYTPVNQPAYLQNIRTEGKTYHSRVMGKVAGQASKTDWGIRGSAYFTYIYGVESIGKIIKNDGVTIIEERQFGKVIEDVVVSSYDVGFELPPKLQTGLNFICATIGALIEQKSGNGDGTRGAAEGWRTGEHINKVISEIKIPFTDEMFKDFRERGMLPKELDPERVKNEMMMFTKTKDTRILEGKKVRITFKDGQGITRIEPMDCKLSQQECDVIKRTNYVMDHYLFPDRKVAPESTWDVDGDVFAGFLDPRLHGKVEGRVSVMRISDFTDASNEVSKCLRLVRGNISFSDKSSQGKAVTGQLSGIKGKCVIPNKYGVVTSAAMSGSMVYKNVSTDHLLFEAKMTVTPKFEISYECIVE